MFSFAESENPQLIFQNPNPKAKNTPEEKSSGVNLYG